MKTWTAITLGCALGFLLVAGSVGAIEKKPVRLAEDYGIETMDNCTLQYYYYIPCPTFSWFWGFFDWTCGDAVGTFFTIGDAPTGEGDTFVACDTLSCQYITGFRVLDFSGYGAAYPGLYTVRFNIYCSDENGCPVGPSLWESLPYETIPEWNSLEVSPPLLVSTCGPGGKPRLLLTATHIGTDCTYPQWGMDNISGALGEGCNMHDIGCLPALYPRPGSGHYPTIHSGYYGVNFQFCPPVWFKDGGDTTQGGTTYGYLEFAWRLLITCVPSVEPTSWGSIKSLYR